MINIKEYVDKFSFEVNDLLTQYLNIHNNMFTFSIGKLIPIPFIFKKIDYESNYQILKKMSSQLGNEINKIDESLSLLTPLSKPFSYLESLRNYILALMVTVDKLYNICYKLQSKIDGKINYSMADYNIDVESYNKSVRHYTSLGEMLNIKYREVNLFLNKTS